LSEYGVEPTNHEASSPVPTLGLSAVEVTNLVNLFQTMLLAMEQRLVAKMDDNSRMASERWAAHDRDFETSTRLAAARMEEIEKSILTVETSLNAHLKRERDEDIRMDARIRPITGSLSWLWLHWRDIVLLVIGIIAAGTFIVESFGRILGPHAP
jgi:hypothetical protein